MRFWDSSALAAVIMREPRSDRVLPILRRDPEIAIWWATPVECESALAQAERLGRLEPAAKSNARDALHWLRERTYEVDPGEELRARASRLLAVHPLRAADALQLAAALVWCGERTEGAAFVCLDDRLREAAAREGFRVLPYSEEVNEP
jgi:predicted nucleic acid-binding protein